MVNETPELSEVIKSLGEIVDENPDYRYAKRYVPVSDDDIAHDAPEYDLQEASCFYVHHDIVQGDVPGCVVGHWLNRQGVDLYDLQQEENNAARNVVGRFFPEVDPIALDILRDVQEKQDAGISWRQAYENALKDNGIDPRTGRVFTDTLTKARAALDSDKPLTDTLSQALDADE